MQRYAAIIKLHVPEIHYLYLINSNSVLHTTTKSSHIDLTDVLFADCMQIYL